MKSDLEDSGTVTIPRRGRGRPSPGKQAAWEIECKTFADRLIEIKSALGNRKQAVRSWCYDLEVCGLTKDEFDYAEGFINDLRQDGLLPIDFTAGDETRMATGGEGFIDTTTPEEEAQDIIDTIDSSSYRYLPESFWDTQPYYVEMVVEKTDLRRNVFDRALCAYPIPCTNGKGWSDKNSRAQMALRFQRHEAEGRTPVLLYCGDHDPKGIQIADTIHKNLQVMAGTWFEDGTRLNWNADSLIVDRFGLTFEFIEEHRLTWIPNLITSSGANLGNPQTKEERAEAKKLYVRGYIAQYGVRKCEANALTPIPDLGHQLAVDNIHKYIDQDAAQAYSARVDAQRQEVRNHIAKLMGRR